MISLIPGRGESILEHASALRRLFLMKLGVPAGLTRTPTVKEVEV